MGVYIKGMKMPERCEKCFMCQSDCMGCKVTQNFIILKKGQNKPSWCPLVEVPPHGDLIDRDALSNDGWTLHKEVMVMGGFAIHELPLINPTIPVIIEAEGKKK